METPQNLKFEPIRMSDGKKWHPFVAESGLRHVSALNKEGMVKTVSRAVSAGIGNPLAGAWRSQGCGQKYLRPKSNRSEMRDVIELLNRGRIF